MKTRLNYFKYIGEGASHLLSLTRYIQNTSLDASLIHLINIRVSQINHYVFCLDMHILEAKLDNMEDRKLHAIAAWRDSPQFSDKEKVALQWTEAVTLISRNDVSNSLHLWPVRKREVSYFHSYKTSNTVYERLTPIQYIFKIGLHKFII